MKITTFVNFCGKVNLTISACCLLCFAWLTWQVIQEKLNDFDAAFLQSLHQIFPSFFLPLAKGVYFIGEAEVAVFLVILSLAILVWRRLWLEAQVVAVSSLGVLLLIDRVLKPLIYRRRPLGRLVENVYGRSFPSGHATGNLLLYFLLVYIIGLRFPQHKVKLYAIATILLLLMGLSSTYLRVHWITDIIAGYLLGYVLFILSTVILRISDPKYRIK